MDTSSPSRHRRISWPAVFVVGVWAVMTAAGVWFVATYGRNCPYTDDWWILAVRCGCRPTSPWIFARYGGHTLVVPKLLWLCCHTLSSGNFLSVPFAAVGLLSGVALALVWTAQQLRGYVLCTDAIFPIACLSWGHWGNLVTNNFCSQFIISTVLALVMLIPFVLPSSPLCVWIVAGCSALLPLCGVNGWAFAPAGLLWLLSKRRYAPALAVLAVLCATAPWRHPGDAPVDDAPAAIAVRAIAYFGTAASPAQMPLWALAFAVAVAGVCSERKDMAAVSLCAAALLGLLLIVWPAHEIYLWLACVPALVLASACCRSVRDGALWCYLAGILCVVAAVAVGRGVSVNLFPPAGDGEAAREAFYRVSRAALPDNFGRYRTLLLPFLCWAYLTNVRSKGLAWVIMTLAIAGAISYIPEAVQRSARDNESKDAFLTDVRSGRPAQFLEASYLHSVFLRGARSEAEAPFRLIFRDCLRCRYGR